MFKTCWIVICCTMMVAVTAAQTGTPSIGSNPPPATGSNPAIPQPAQNAQLITVTGLVSDSLCLRHHYILSNATPAECVRYCIAHGGSYVILAGDKVYNLQDDPGHVLESLANQQATVTGWLVDPSHLEIKSVQPTGKSGK